MHNVPVFDTVSRAVAETGADMTILFVAAARAKDAIFEAVDGGLRNIVCVAEFMPVHNSIEINARLRQAGARWIGPNCSGLISPGKAKVGFYCDEVCIPGDIGVVSKSGTLSYAVLLELKRCGIGASTAIGVGGDEIKGTTFRDCIEQFNTDPDTRAMVLLAKLEGARRSRRRIYSHEREQANRSLYRWPDDPCRPKYWARRRHGGR